MSRYGAYGEPGSSKHGHSHHNDYAYSDDEDYKYARRLQQLEEDDEDLTWTKSAYIREQNHLTAPPNDVSTKEDLYPEEIRCDLEEIQAFTAKNMSITCYKCDTRLMQDISVSKWYKRWADAQKRHESTSICALPCPKCRAFTCVGCGRKPVMGKTTANVRDFTLDWCCEDGRLFAIWLLLCTYDETELALLPQADPQVKKPMTSVGKQPGQVLPTGTGYASITTSPSYLYGPTGGTVHYDSQQHSDVRMLDFKRTDQKMDGMTKAIFDLITHLLPLQKGKAAPIGLSDMIELSLFQERAAQLLRNDSIQDIQSRASLYRSILRFVEKVGSHPDTRFLVIDGRYVKKRSPGLQYLSVDNNIEDRGKGKNRAKGKGAHLLEVETSQKSMSSSLLDSMKNLNIQSDALLKTTRAVKSGFNDGSGQEMLDLARRVTNLYKELTGLAFSKDAGKHRGKPGSKAAEWATYCAENRVAHVSGEVMANMRADLQEYALRLRDSPRNRLKVLTVQVTDLHTSLPEGIFIKAEESRIDVLKCLIVGPDDTPYEGGLFEFDILCPRDFPFRPPNVKLRTTGGGKIRFNPNLKSDGEVCLSLLGTWEGRGAAERWQPGKSTILQVLVSIQAMIFNSTPWRNEPGYENSPDTPTTRRLSDQYNFLRQSWTVRFAMLEWLQRSEKRNGLWKDIVAKYFELKGRKIFENVRRWAQVNPQIESYDGIGSRLFGRQNLLKELDQALSGCKK